MFSSVRKLGRYYAAAPSAVKALGGVGLFLTAVMIGIRFVSSAFEPGPTPPLCADILCVSLMAAAGCAYMALFRILPGLLKARAVLTAAFVIGVLMRLVFFGSAPVSEDDWHRYLWDGAAVAHGVDPYAYPPADAFSQDLLGAPAAPTQSADLAALRKIGQAHPDTLSRINYPYVSTIYPPLAQLGFAAAYMIAPFNLDAWRIVLLTADIAGFFLLVAALGAVSRNRLWALLYWWNPIVIVTTFNAGHMDALLTPFILGAVLLVLKGRPYWAAVSLAAAAGVKFWPVILAPVLFGKLLEHPFKLVRVALVFIAAASAFIAPMLLSLDVGHSGLAAYAQSWERNAFLFPLIVSGVDALGADGGLWARVFVAGAVCGMVLVMSFHVRADPGKMIPSLFIATTLLFFLSPTGFPWYFVWIAMLLPFAPSFGVGLLTMTLSLYYMRFPLQENGLESLYANYLVLAQFLLPLSVVALQLWRVERRARA